MTGNHEESWLARRRRQEAETRQALAEQRVENIRQLESLSDAELIAQAPGFPGPGYQMEMDRRLKAAITELTGEIVTFRESSDLAAGKLARLTNVLIALTAIIVILTVALILRAA